MKLINISFKIFTGILNVAAVVVSLICRAPAPSATTYLPPQAVRVTGIPVNDIWFWFMAADGTKQSADEGGGRDVHSCNDATNSYIRSSNIWNGRLGIRRAVLNMWVPPKTATMPNIPGAVISRALPSISAPHPAASLLLLA